MTARSPIHDPRHHFYLSRCEDCKWYECCNAAPIKADRRAISHARRYPSHKAIVIDVTALKVVGRHCFDSLPQVADDPPF